MLWRYFNTFIGFTYLISGQIAVMDYLINEVKVDPLATDSSGMTTVHVATQNQMFDAVKVLTIWSFFKNNFF